MGIIDTIFGNRKDSQVLQGASHWDQFTAYTPIFTTYREELFESDVVRSSVDAIARHASKLAVSFLGPAKQKLKTAIAAKPNPFHTWSQFLYRTAMILSLQNTCFIVPIINEFDETIGLYPLRATNAEILDCGSRGLFLRYKFTTGQTAAIELERVAILTRHQFKNEVFGDENTALFDVLKVEDINKQGIREAIKKSAEYRFMAQATNFTKSDDLKKERSKFSLKNLEVEEGNTGLLLFPHNYQNIKQIEPKNYVLDSDRMKAIKTSVYEYFGVNEAIVQNRATTAEFEAFYEGCIEPFAVQLAQTLTNALYTALEQSYGNEVNVSSNRLSRLSWNDRVSYVNSMADRGLLTINELREVLELPPIEHGDVFPRRGEYYYDHQGKF